MDPNLQGLWIESPADTVPDVSAWEMWLDCLEQATSEPVAAGELVDDRDVFSAEESLRALCLLLKYYRDVFPDETGLAMVLSDSYVRQPSAMTLDPAAWEDWNGYLVQARRESRGEGGV